MAMTAATPAGEPMTDINTTPLIDVMLVLLIMFIITIPLQNHAVKLDLPTASPPTVVNTVKNKVTIDAKGTIFWNGTATNLLQLRQYLDMTQQMSPVPELQVQPDPQARYAVVDEVLGVTKKAQVEKMGFVGNDAYRAAF